jgi:Flp pilus assembly protein TadD
VGYLYYAHGNYPEAARFFGRACAADPTDGDQFLYLGMALMRMGQLTDAEKAARTALLVRPKGKNYHLGLGMVLRGEGKLSEARTEVAAELAEDPQNAQAKTLLNEITGQVEGPAGKPAGEQPSKGQSTVIK